MYRVHCRCWSDVFHDWESCSVRCFETYDATRTSRRNPCTRKDLPKSRRDSTAVTNTCPSTGCTEHVVLVGPEGAGPQMTGKAVPRTDFMIVRPTTLRLFPKSRCLPLLKMTGPKALMSLKSALCFSVSLGSLMTVVTWNTRQITVEPSIDQSTSAPLKLKGDGTWNVCVDQPQTFRPRKLSRMHRHQT